MYYRNNHKFNPFGHIIDKSSADVQVNQKSALPAEAISQPADDAIQSAQSLEKPTNPPPLTSPEKTIVDPAEINNHLNSQIYVWLANGHSFWMYPTRACQRVVSGYVWSAFGWVFMGIDARSIDTFAKP